MHSKESQLRKRLDVLDKELQTLHARVASRCSSFLERKVQDNFSEADQSRNHVQFNKYTVTNKTNAKKRSTANKENEFMQDDCKKFLQTISKSIAKGSEAINKIASLTEISSFTGLTGQGDLLPSSFGPSSKDIIRNKSGTQKLTKSQCETFLAEVEKIIKKLHFPEKEGSMTSTAPTKNLDFLPEEMLVENFDENIIVLNILKEKLAAVKKKLRDERAKRENAEKASSGYRRRLEALERKTTGPDSYKAKSKTAHSLPEKTETIIICDIPEKENEAQQCNKNKPDEEIKELKVTLAENMTVIENLKESKQMAETMVNTLRDKICHHDPHELDKLKEENQNLQEKLIHWQKKAEAQPGIIDKLLERAEQAERDLIDKMKECNHLIARSSVNDPEVQKLLERHKLAYKELVLEKQRKEKEFRNQTNLLKKELETIKFGAEKKLAELNEKYKNSLNELHGKEIALESFMKDKNIFENEISDLKMRLKNAMQSNEVQEATISELQEMLLINNKKLEKLSIEYEGEKATLQLNMETKLKELNDILADKENVIQSLRQDVVNCKDTISIKDKMLKDQIDTIKCLRTVSDNTKKALDDERIQKQKLEKEIHKLQISKELLQKKLIAYEKKENEENSSFISLNQKSRNNLLQIEAQVCKRQRSLEKRLSEMSYERDQAVQTARFATEKMILAINDYETKLSVQRRLYNILNGAYKEKEFELQIANQQLNDLNEELWKCAKNAEKMKNELQMNLMKACAVCTDVISAQIVNDLRG